MSHGIQFIVDQKVKVVSHKTVDLCILVSAGF